MGKPRGRNARERMSQSVGSEPVSKRRVIEAKPNDSQLLVRRSRGPVARGVGGNAGYDYWRSNH